MKSLKKTSRDGATAWVSCTNARLSVAALNASLTERDAGR